MVALTCNLSAPWRILHAEFDIGVIGILSLLGSFLGLGTGLPLSLQNRLLQSHYCCRERAMEVQAVFFAQSTDEGFDAQNIGFIAQVPVELDEGMELVRIALGFGSEDRG